jgi:hypothetical protein
MVGHYELRQTGECSGAPLVASGDPAGVTEQAQALTLSAFVVNRLPAVLRRKMSSNHL